MKKLGFGFMRLPLKDANDPRSVDIPQLEKMVDTFLERGYTYFDTAYLYHKYTSELALREVLVKRHPRESFYLADKLPLIFLKAEGDQERIFAEQLEKCGVEYFDNYLLHNIGAHTYETAKKFDSFAFIAGLKAQGKARHIGFSFHDKPELLDEILTLHPEMEFVQLQLNYLDWENKSIQSRRCYEVAQKHNKPVIVMETIKGGTLAQLPPEAEALLRARHPDWSPASWAVRYAASLEGVQQVLSGMSAIEQLDDNTTYMQDFQPLTAEEHAIIEKVVEIINATAAIPCTSCRYCVDGCPMNIPIPDYFTLYNADQQALNKGFSTQSTYYRNFTKDHGKASECIQCGQCESACPQHIPVIEWLQKVAQNFEK